jgi:hypothetical protein
VRLSAWVDLDEKSAGIKKQARYAGKLDTVQILIKGTESASENQP